MKNILIFAFVIITLGCSDNKNCEKAMCTEVFTMIVAKLSDTSNLDLKGVSTQTILLSSGEVIHTQSEPNDLPENGFTVVDDGDIKELGFNANQKVELKISKNGDLIKTVSYTITTDCCHVSKTDGPFDVSLN